MFCWGVVLAMGACCWEPQAKGDESAKLVGHWPLKHDGRDLSGNDRHAIEHGVRFEIADTEGQQAAYFNGRDAWLEVVEPGDPDLAAGDFSMALWAQADGARDDGQGDLICQFDPRQRQGFQLTLQSLSGVTNAQPNDRHLSFGVDAGSRGRWLDRGRPGEAIYVFALAVHEGQLYAATFESGADKHGHVYRYDGEQRWVDCGSPDVANSVMSLAVYNGQLYAGTGRYNAGGSALEASPNDHPGGRVFRLEEGGGWIDCGRLGEANEAFAMVVYGQSLYAIPLYSQGLFRYEGDQTWVDCGSPGKRLMSLVVYNGALLAAGNEGGTSGGVYRYSPEEGWSVAGYQAGVSQVYSFAVIGGKLHVGTWPEGKVFRDDGQPDWTSVGQLGDELEVMGMAPYNGKLYGGTLPLAAVYRYDGPDRWSSTGRLDRTPDVRYRRAWSMAVYNGELFCGTLPSGRVHSYEAGCCVTHDRELKTGWRHVAAVRRGNVLELYVDGRLVGQKEMVAAFAAHADAPLRIGFGEHDFFRGHLRDVRIYRGALSADELVQLMADTR